jgi:hypothetical protein
LVGQSSPPSSRLAPLRSHWWLRKNIYSFSPRGSPCQSSQPFVSVVPVSERTDGILVLILLIMPKLHDMCGEVRSNSHEI